MAEVVVGFISAGVGITAFALQISSSIDALHQMRLKPGQAHKDLTTLLDTLSILHEVVSSLKAWEGYKPVNLIIRHVQERYEEIEPDLRGLLQKYQGKGEGPRHHWKRAQLMVSRHPKQRINDISRSIHRVINILNMASVAAQCQPPNTPGLKILAEEDPNPSAVVQEGPQHGKSEQATDSAAALSNAAVNPSCESQQHPVILSAVRTTSRVGHTRKYGCTCDLAGKSGRFWFLQYTPLSNFINKPNQRTSGCSCVSLRVRLALSIYGVPIAIVAGIGLMFDETGFEIRPALRAENIVNYTSPGFETIWRLAKGLMSFPEARAGVMELYRSDSSLRYHRDPAGNSYIQTLLRYPWGWLQDDQFRLLDVFVNECKMTMEDESQIFLVQCAEWIGEGRHLSLLEAILAYGFDATAINASPFGKWPVTCSPDWYGSGDTPDPFFIQYVGTILRYSPSYSGSTYLHHVLLNGSYDTAVHWLHRSRPLKDNVNFLGQTPLHIVINNANLCRLVLEQEHDIDVTDKYGATPLMYAAAMGQTEVVKLLISSGANLGLRDTRLSWTFLDYAFFRGHWNLALEALLVIQAEFEPSIFQLFVRCAIIGALSHCDGVTETSTERIFFLTQTIGLCDDVNFRFGDGNVKDNNLMHYACTIEVASALVQSGFHSFNQRNSEGKLAIDTLAKRYSAPVIQLCLENGTDIGTACQDGRNILFDLLPKLASFNWLTWDVMDSIKLCLSAGADPFTTDDCLCPCSPDGCHLSSIFEIQFNQYRCFDRIPGPLWAFELLTLLEEHRGIKVSSRMLLSLLRRLQCDQDHTSIAHVCCHRGYGIGQLLLKPKCLEPENIEDILDEETDFIAVLETEMAYFSSLAFSELLTEFMTRLKQRYNTQVEIAETEREKRKPDLRPSMYEVDYKADEFKMTISAPFMGLSANSIARPIAEYAFWLQHERFRIENPLVSDFHKAGWFERRISWVVEFMDTMGVTDEMLEEEMGKISIEETRTEQINCGETVKVFLETWRETKMKGR